MRNIGIYGTERVGKAMRSRAVELEALRSEGEKAARMMAWHSFITDLVSLDDGYERVMNVARTRYGEAAELFIDSGQEMDTGYDNESFSKHFYDELFVINKRVTNKAVQATFYIFVALALFGLFKLFF